MSWSGIVRIYFNTKAEAPLVWSVDDGDQSNEINVSEIVMHSAHNFSTKFNASNKWPLPAGWIEGQGFVEVKDGVAHIYG